MQRPVIAAITGGIGSGKSVVSRMLQVIGYKVYDCDSRAKQLMDSNAQLKTEISEKITSEAINPDQTINRKALAAAVFTNAEKLRLLNTLVHNEVKHDFKLWIDSNAAEQIVFVETAILFNSGFDSLVDCVVRVDAPDEIRIDRVMQRNSISREEVLRRIEAQSSEMECRHPATIDIDNSGTQPLLPVVESLADTIQSIVNKGSIN